MYRTTDAEGMKSLAADARHPALVCAWSYHGPGARVPASIHSSMGKVKKAATSQTCRRARLKVSRGVGLWAKGEVSWVPCCNKALTRAEQFLTPAVFLAYLDTE